MEATIGKYGNIGYEVVKDGRQVGLFRAQSQSKLDRSTGKSFDAAPTEEAMAEALRHAETFAAAIG